MISSPVQRTVAKLTIAISLVAASAVLSACGGSGTGGSVLSSFSNEAKVRFVNGSPDAGAVDVIVDNNTSTPLFKNVAYTNVADYLTLASGQHTLTIEPAGNDTGTPVIPTQNVSVNTGARYSIVLSGETHPSYQAAADIGIITFTDGLYSTPGGGAAVNVHNTAPFSASFAGSTVAFGYSLQNGGSGTVGSPVGVGSLTQPFGLPNNALSLGITFFAQNATSGMTVTPSQIDPSGCAANTLPCNSGNLSLYFADGPAASTTPTAGPYPNGATATTKGILIGKFDSNNF